MKNANDHVSRSTDRYPGSTCSILTRVRSIELLLLSTLARGLNTPQLWLIPSRNKDNQLWIIPFQDALFQPPIHVLSNDMMGTGALCQSGEVEPKI